MSMSREDHARQEQSVRDAMEKHGYGHVVTYQHGLADVNEEQSYDSALGV